MGTVLLDRYELLDKLGSGAMADVHRARDTKLRRDVAIKILHPHVAESDELRGRFAREARAAAALDHGNILKVFDVHDGDDNEPAFIVMELLAGQSLDEFLSTSGTPLAEVAAMIGAVLADAIQAAHDAGVVHRDIKPANIMIAKGGRLVVCDFGMARLSDEGATLTRAGAVMGTPAFMSPEQALGEAVGAPSDVYSLGATLYQLTTGALPASGSTPLVISRISQGDVTPPLRRNPRIGQQMARVIEKMMATDIRERVGSAGDAGELLRAVATDSGFTKPVAAELAEYFAEPAAYNAIALPRIVDSGIRRAQAAAKARRVAKSLSLVDRVLALDPHNQQAQDLLASFNRRLHMRTLGRVAVAAFLLCCVALLGWQIAHTGGGPSVAIVDATPVIAVQEPDAAAAATVTATIDAARQVTVRRSGHQRVRPSRPTVSKSDAAPIVKVVPSPPRRGMLLVQIRPWCDVVLDGRAVGRSPMQAAIEVAPGTHHLSCTQNIAGGRTFSRTLSIRAGQTLMLSDSLHSAIAVRLDVDQSHVRIAKSVYRNKTTIRLAPGRHMIEVLDGQKLVERGWVEVSTRACTLRRRPELGCY